MALTANMNKAWVLETVPRGLSPFLKEINEIRNIYHVIHWEDFCMDIDKYAAKIEAMMVTTFGMPELSQDLLDRMINLKAVVTLTSGRDHLNQSLLRKYNVKVYSLDGATSDACADMAFNLLLAVARRNNEATALTRESADAGKLDALRIFQTLGHDVTGRTLGILGMGAIGYEVARRATGFKMETLYFSRTRRTSSDEFEVKAKYCPSMDDVLTQADFLVLCLPLTEETRHVIGKEQFQKMKSNAIIINVARGELIDHDALTCALQGGVIAGAGLDVTHPEPLPPSHQLLHMTNVIVSPHLSAFTKGMGEKVYQKTKHNLSDALS